MDLLLLENKVKKIIKLVKRKRYRRPILIGLSILALLIGYTIMKTQTPTVSVPETKKIHTINENFICSKDNKKIKISMDSNLVIQRLDYEFVVEEDNKLQEELDLYNSIYGVIAKKKNNTVTIRYELSKIKLNQIQTEIKDSLLSNIEKLPLYYPEFKKAQLSGYECT